MGSATANSFGTVAEADTYFNTQYHPDAPWEDLDADVKAKVLIMAAQWMSSLIEWTGYVVDATQSLPWPRSGMLKRNMLEYVAEDEIPSEVKYAQFELARLLGYEDRTVESEITAKSITSLKVSNIEMTFKELAMDEPMIPSVATNLLVPSWIESINGSSSGTRELVRA